MASSRDLVPLGDFLFGPFRLSSTDRLLARHGTPVMVAGRALDVLLALVGRAGEVVSQRELSDLVWPDVVVADANLRVHVAALRKALGDGKDGARYIVNVPGRGYSFVAPVERLGAALSDAPTHSARTTGLPALPRLILGRDDTVATLSALLLARRFVSIVGPGGIGKTTVAVAVAHALEPEFGDDAICFVDFGSLADPADVASALASALGCIVRGPDPEPYILAFVAEKRVLVVLDNCEHVIEAAGPLAERLVRAAPQLHLLATSREALRVEGERRHLLMPLDSPSGDTPSAAEALASPAVQLFMERAAVSGYRGALADADAPLVADICRRLDGIALAIELVASRVGTFGIHGTAQLLAEGSELQLSGRRGASPRHRSLQSLLDWSFALLSSDEKVILCRLSVFAGPFTAEAAQSVVGADAGDALAVANAIVGLVDKSLVWVATTGGVVHYRLPDTTRVYAETKFPGGVDRVALARRHARYFCELLDADEIEAAASAGRTAITYAPHLGNVRKALAWAFSSSGDLSFAVELAARAADLFVRLSLLGECQQWCQRALALLREADRGTRRELELQEALAISLVYAQGNGEVVRAAIERGLVVAEALQDAWHRLQLLAALNLFLSRRGDFNGALAIARGSAAVAEDSGGADECLLAEWQLGSAHHMAGDQAAALRHCQRGLEPGTGVTATRTNFFGHEQRVRALASYARAQWLRGFPDRARSMASRAVDESARSQYPISYSITLVYCTSIFTWMGAHDTAAAYNQAAMAQIRTYYLGPYHAVALAQRGELLIGQGEVAEGVGLLQQALQSLGAMQHRTATSATSRALAEGLALSGRPDQGLATVDDALRRAESVGEAFWLPDLLRTRGEILLMLARPDPLAAEAALRRAMACAHEQSALSWELRAAIPLARLWAAAGETDRARAMLEPIRRRFTEGFDTRDLLAADRLLAELPHGPP